MKPETTGFFDCLKHEPSKSRKLDRSECPAATPQQMDQDQQDVSRRRKPQISPCGDGTFVMFLLMGDRI